MKRMRDGDGMVWVNRDKRFDGIFGGDGDGDGWGWGWIFCIYNKIEKKLCIFPKVSYFVNVNSNQWRKHHDAINQFTKPIF